MLFPLGMNIYIVMWNYKRINPRWGSLPFLTTDVLGRTPPLPSALLRLRPMLQSPSYLHGLRPSIALVNSD